jgi:hypothetical protein
MMEDRTDDVMGGHGHIRTAPLTDDEKAAMGFSKRPYYRLAERIVIALRPEVGKIGGGHLAEGEVIGLVETLLAAAGASPEPKEPV